MRPTEQELTDLAIKEYGDHPHLWAQQRDGFKAGYLKAISQMEPEWVAVTEGYPEIGAQCYFYRRGTSDFVFTGQYNGIDQWGDNYFKEDDKPAYYRDVTHYLVFSKPQPPTDKP